MGLISSRFLRTLWLPLYRKGNEKPSLRSIIPVSWTTLPWVASMQDLSRCSIGLHVYMVISIYVNEKTAQCEAILVI